MLPREYMTHARVVDREYGGVPEGVVGPVQDGKREESSADVSLSGPAC